jgi:hypothetical protein
MKVLFGQVMLSVLLVLAAVPLAYSLHELDHRYDVTGYILDAEQQPLDGVPVVAQLDGKRIGSGSSDSKGYFRFRMHLHDSDVGRELRLKTPESQGTIRVTLTPGDSSTERIHHVNFIGGKLVEGELPGRGGISVASLGVAAVAVLLAGGLLVARKTRSQRRRRQRAAQQSESPGARKASRGRKRKNRKWRR